MGGGHRRSLPPSAGDHPGLAYKMAVTCTTHLPFSTAHRYATQGWHTRWLSPTPPIYPSVQPTGMPPRVGIQDGCYLHHPSALQCSPQVCQYRLSLRPGGSTR